VKGKTWACERKIAAREGSILIPAREKGWVRCPGDLYSLGGLFASRGGVLPGSEIHQLVGEPPKFVPAERYNLIDLDPEVIRANREAVRGTVYEKASFYEGEFFAVLNNLYRLGVFRPSVVIFDTTSEAEATFRLARRILRLLNLTRRRILFVVNFILARTYPASRRTTPSDFRTLVAPFRDEAESSGWIQVREAEEYGGTGHRSATTMMYMTFWREQIRG
jgi:hypothetical protein